MMKATIPRQSSSSVMSALETMSYRREWWVGSKEQGRILKQNPYSFT